MLRLKSIESVLKKQSRNFARGYPMNAADCAIPKKEKEESERMKKFHEQLKLEKLPRVGSAMRYVDLMLVETDPKSGELISNTDKNPTRWGDWQHNGKVSDF